MKGTGKIRGLINSIGTITGADWFCCWLYFAGPWFGICRTVPDIRENFHLSYDLPLLFLLCRAALLPWLAVMEMCVEFAWTATFMDIDRKLKTDTGGCAESSGQQSVEVCPCFWGHAVLSHSETICNEVACIRLPCLQRYKEVCGGGGIAPSIPRHGSRSRWVGQFHASGTLTAGKERLVGMLWRRWISSAGYGTPFIQSASRHSRWMNSACSCNKVSQCAF